MTNFRKIMKIPKLKKVWSEAMCNELKIFSQVWGKKKGTNIVRFSTHKEIIMTPKERIITYTQVVVNYPSRKDDPNRVWLAVGGEKLKGTYLDELTARTADLTTTKTIWNSVISTPIERNITGNIKSTHLQTLLKRKDYMNMPIDMISQEFRDAYDLDAKAKNGLVYMKILCGMYGLTEAGIRANKLLCAWLENSDTLNYCILQYYGRIFPDQSPLR